MKNLEIIKKYDVREKLESEYTKAATTAKLITENISQVIVGKQNPVELATIALMSGGHILVEDVPGVGKTVLAKSLAISSGCSFKRIQFTPDLLPTDVSGVSIYNQKSGDFEFREGPIVSQIVLADEINRATPKTQSAMLEAMEENQVTMEGITRDLPKPFMVIATQNPIEYEGTFPLPEAQLDRFLMKINLGYPDQSEEILILDSQSLGHPIDKITPVVTPQMVTNMQDIVKTVYVDDLIKEYIVKIVSQTRNILELNLGSSPRGSIALHRASQALALMRNRDYVLPDDIKQLATSILAHRLIPSPSARMNGTEPGQIIEDLVKSIPIPGERSQNWLRR
ncbi:MoxR family ATPase [Chloroflexi bacterium]|nr:MoxR family ATPase [Chloroflexota bacterium]